jgi:hypothetical protein
MLPRAYIEIPSKAAANLGANCKKLSRAVGGRLQAEGTFGNLPIAETVVPADNQTILKQVMHSSS